MRDGKRETETERRERKGSFGFIEKGEIGLRDKERWCERGIETREKKDDWE